MAVIATNASLTKAQTTKLAALSSIGMVRAIAPINTTADGDIVFALSLGSQTASIDALGAAGIEALEQAIFRAVRTAKTMGGVPGLAG